MDYHWTQSFDEHRHSKDITTPRGSAFSFKPAMIPSELRSFEESLSTPRARLKPRLLQSPLATSSGASTSRSVSNAMKALQERIKELEESSAGLEDKLKSHQSQESKFESRWRLRLAEEVQLSQERSRQSQAALDSVQKQLNDALSKLESQQTEANVHELEAKRLKEALAVAQETLQKRGKKMQQQIEIVNAQLNARKDEFDRVKLGLQQAMYEKQLLTEELKQSRDQAAVLQSELDQVKDLFNAKMKDSETVRYIQLASTQELDYSRKNAELMQQLKRQELVITNLEQEKQHHIRLIDQLDSQIQDLNLKTRTMDQENRKDLTSTAGYSAQQLAKQALIGSDRLVQTHQHRHRPHSTKLKRPDIRIRSPRHSVEISSILSPNSTTTLEQEISELNRQYKVLLAKASEDDADLESLRLELNTIAAAMEAKSHNLYTIRRKEEDRQLGL